MPGAANPLERLLALAIALALRIVRGILLAPLVALRRALSPPRVSRCAPWEVVDLRHRVLRSGRPRADAVWDGDTDPTTRHYAARWGGEIVGVCTVLARPYPDGDGPSNQVRGMAVAPEVRGKGIGRAMLAAVEADLGAPLWCNARDTAIAFYEREGWTLAGERFDIEGVGPHRRMILARPRHPGPGT